MIIRQGAASEYLNILMASGVEVPILLEEDGRWSKLQLIPDPLVDLADRFRGALVGGAIGDAMGRAVEGWPAEAAEAEQIREYRAWRAWRGGPKGTITDDTQMTMWLAESILATAERAMAMGSAELRDQLIDPDDLAQRFTRERIRGIGEATREFVRNYKDLGKPWYEAGVPVGRQRDGHASRARRPRPPRGSLSDLSRLTPSVRRSPTGTPWRSPLRPVRRMPWPGQPPQRLGL